MKDEIIKCLAHDGKINVVCAKTTNLVEDIRKIHDLNPTPTAALGRLLTMASIMGSNLKNETDNITLKVKGNGPIGSMIVIVNKELCLKGSVTNPFAELPLNEKGKLNVGGVVGNEGYINVVKDIGLKQPYVGNSPLVSGEIAEDFANYFNISEQTPSIVNLGVLVDKTGEVLSAGGYMITAMPDADEETISKIEEAVKKSLPISELLRQNTSLLGIAKICTADENVKIVKDGLIPKAKCDCSKERVEKAIIAMGKDELEKIINEDKKLEASCHFCLKKYNFTEAELINILEKCKNKIS